MKMDYFDKLLYSYCYEILKVHIVSTLYSVMINHESTPDFKFSCRVNYPGRAHE